jgi:hypothetical protein
MANLSERLPKQRISMSQKTEEWGKNNIDEIESIINSDSYNGRSSRYKKQVNYDLYNGRLNREDFEYVISPHGFEADDFPAELQHYDQMSPKLNLLLGEEMKRPFNYRVICTNSDAVSLLAEKRKEMTFSLILSEVELFLKGEEKRKAAPGSEESQIPQTPQQIERYLTYTYRDLREITGQRSLTYLRKEQYLDYKFNQGFKHAIIAGEEVYYVGFRGGEPHVRNVNPLDVSFIMDPDSHYAEDALAAVEERWLTPASIVDEFHDELSDKQISAIESNAGRTNNTGTDAPEINYPHSDITIQGSDAYDKDNTYRRTRGEDGSIRVIHVEWKSMKKIGFLSFYNENGEYVEELVDENFKLPEEYNKRKNTKKKTVYSFMLGEFEAELTWNWISEVWEGTKIGDDIYIGIQAKMNQRRNMDNPSRCKLGYVGYLYNAMNSESVSLIDRMKTYQYMYNIISYRLELAIAKSKGKLMLMDIAQIPASEGWDVDKWMYYLESMGVAFINSQEEGKRGQNPQFNQFQSIDMTMGQIVIQYISLLENLKEQIGEVAGVTRQRQGQMTNSELVGNVERSVIQSSHITEYWFSYHNEVKRRVLEALLDVSKMAWKNGKKISYIMDDMSRVFMEIDGTDFDSSEYGVFVGNSTKEEQAIEMLKGLAQPALQSGVIKMSEVADIMMSESVADVKNRLKKAELDMEKAQAEQAQREQEAQRLLQQQQNEAIARENAREDANKAADRQNKIDIALINAAAKQQDATDIDADDNGIKDEIDRERVALVREKQANDLATDNARLDLDRKKHADQMSMKEKELQLKKKQGSAKKDKK